MRLFKLMIETVKLFEIYLRGWDECFSGKNNSEEYEGIERIAYNVGWGDYILGDDISSVDLQSNEEILQKIKDNAE